MESTRVGLLARQQHGQPSPAAPAGGWQTSGSAFEELPLNLTSKSELRTAQGGFGDATVPSDPEPATRRVLSAMGRSRSNRGLPPASSFLC